MNIASIKLCDCANGPGMRTSVFVSGCRRHCPGCFNEVAWDFNYGNELTEELLEVISYTLKEDWIEGISILGGEPFEYENQPGVAVLCIMAKAMNKSVWVYTGFTFNELTEEIRPECWKMFDCIDVIVDGPFIESQKDITLAFRGSRNQRIIDVQETKKEGRVVLMEEYA